MAQCDDRYERVMSCHHDFYIHILYFLPLMTIKMILILVLKKNTSIDRLAEFKTAVAEGRNKIVNDAKWSRIRNYTVQHEAMRDEARYLESESEKKHGWKSAARFPPRHVREHIPVRSD